MIIWVASYPRSGNTYLRVILHHVFGLDTCSLHGDTKDIAAHSATREMVGHSSLPSGWTEVEARSDDRSWLVKTHELPAGGDKAIYVIRDGRETLVSYFNYLHRYTDNPPSMLAVLVGAVGFGPWSDHVKAWDPLAREETLLIRFEDLVEDPLGSIPLIGDFLRLQPASASIPGFAELHAINPDFFRSGRTDSWKTTLSEDEHNLFWLIHGHAMAEYGYENDMPELYRTAMPSFPQEASGTGKGRFDTLGELATDWVRRLSCEIRSLTLGQSRELARRDQEHQMLKARTTNLERELAQIRGSLSWRLTKPFRAVSRGLRKLKQ